MSITLSSLATALLYMISAWLLFRHLTDQSTTQTRFTRLAPAIVAMLLHLMVLLSTVFTDQGTNLSFFNAMSLTGLLLVLLLLLLSIKQPVENLGIGVFPLTAITVLLALVFHDAGSMEHLSMPLQFHILCSVIAYSLLAISATQAILLILQINKLHSHHPGGFIRTLPSLYLMETILFQLIATGFIFLTLSLVSGIIYIDDLFEQHLAHKTILSIIAWAFFATLLSGRIIKGWRGKTAIRWTLGGFGFLAVAYFGSKLVLELILQQ